MTKLFYLELQLSSGPILLRSAGMILLFTFLLASLPSQASASILISELYPAPATGESEWVELFNESTQSAQLAGWTLEDHLSTPSTIYIFTDGELGANQFLVVELPSAKLNNSADGVTLKNNQNETVHSISYQGSSPGTSWSVAAGGGLYESVPTPGSANAPQPLPSPSPVPSPTNSPSPSPTPNPSTTAAPTPTPSPPPPNLALITLTEVMACPTSGQDEWIEIYSAATTPIFFTGTATDEKGNQRQVAQILEPSTYTTLPFSGSMLNNTGDTLTLSSGATILGTLEYSSCTQGKSFQYLDSSWQELPPSPGSAPSTPGSVLGSTHTNQAGANQTAGGTLKSLVPSPSPAQQSRKVQSPPPSLPIPQLTNTPQEPPAQPPQALTLSHPPLQPIPLASGILGGLVLTAAGWHGHEKLRTKTPHTPQRISPPNTLGSVHFHTVGAERPPGV